MNASKSAIILAAALILSISAAGKFTAMCFALLAGANLLGNFMTLSRIPMVLANAIAALDIAPMLVMVAIIIVLCFLGCFIPAIPLVLICVPIFVPIAKVSDAVRSRRMPMLACTACCVAAGAVMRFRGVSGTWEAAALVLLFVVGTATSSPLAFVVLRDSFPISLYGTASGLMNILPPLWSVVLQKTYGSIHSLASKGAGLNSFGRRLFI